MIAAPLSGAGILIYPRQRPELSVWVALAMSLFRDCDAEGSGARSMKLTILFVVVVGAILVWWLRSVKLKRGV
jgi:hypothetical protein